MEVVDRATRDQRERVLVASPLVRRSPLRRFEDRAPLGAERFELGLRERGARLDVVSEVLADLGEAREGQVLIEPLSPVRRLVVARPLDAAAPAQLVVTEAC